MSVGGRVRVLFVEDTCAYVEVISKLLAQSEHCRFGVVEVSQWHNALAAIREGCFDVLLIDQDLAGYSGINVLRAARELGCRKAVVILSSSNDPEIRATALSSGAACFLVKSRLSIAVLEMGLLFAMERTAHLAELEGMVDRRTEELRRAQAHMVQQETLANLGGLVAGVAHEINTPLGVGVTAASLLRSKTLEAERLFHENGLGPEQLAKYLALAAESSALVLANLQRAAELIRSFKRVAVDQAGHQRRRFGVRQTIEDVITSMRPAFKNSDHKIVLECDDDLIVDSLPGIYSQIFTNLLSNSLVHGFCDGRSGCISIVVSEDEGGLRIIYSDNGSGMSAEAQKRIFVPFFTTTRNMGGSGLGGSIIFNSVKQLGGSIEVESNEGAGATFLLNLPAEPVKESSQVESVI